MEVTMLEKIDKFIDKYLNWKVLLNLGLAEVCLLPYMLITSTYNMPVLFKIIMALSIGTAISCTRRATKSIKNT